MHSIWWYPKYFRAKRFLTIKSCFFRTNITTMQCDLQTSDIKNVSYYYDDECYSCVYLHKLVAFFSFTYITAQHIESADWWKIFSVSPCSIFFTHSPSSLSHTHQLNMRQRRRVEEKCIEKRIYCILGSSSNIGRFNVRCRVYNEFNRHSIISPRLLLHQYWNVAAIEMVWDEVCVSVVEVEISRMHWNCGIG